jgi:hypothetical protein
MRHVTSAKLAYYTPLQVPGQKLGGFRIGEHFGAPWMTLRTGCEVYGWWPVIRRGEDLAGWRVTAGWLADTT